LIGESGRHKLDRVNTTRELMDHTIFISYKGPILILMDLVGQAEPFSMRFAVGMAFYAPKQLSLHAI